MITSLVIIFKDVDYYSTFQNLLNTLYEANDYSGGLPYTKAQICDIINRLVYPHYLLFHNQFEYEPMPPEEFFKIEESQVFINEEARPFITGHKASSYSGSLICVLDINDKASYAYAA